MSLDLIRGYLEDGTNPPYASAEFVPHVPFTSLSDNPRAVSREANRRALFDSGLVLASGLSDAEVAAAVSTGACEIGGATIKLRDHAFDVEPALIAKIRALCQELGLGQPNFAIFGNPAALTTFFPSVLVHDYNHDVPEVRKGVFRIEGAAIVQSTGLVLQQHAIELREQAGIDIVGKVPFSWESVRLNG